jgi:hypothetical protein
MKYLDGWMFSYSDTNKLWSAAPREHSNLIFNDYASRFVLRSKSFEDLQAFIIKIKGNVNSDYLRSL